MKGWVLALLGGLMASLGATLTQAAEGPSAAYGVNLDARSRQVAHIEARFRGLEVGAPFTLHFPVWRTGLYRVIDPAGTVSELEAMDMQGGTVALTRVGTASWRGTVPSTGEVTLRYRLYANSLEDRTRDIDADHAFLNPGAVFPYLEALRDAPLTVQLALPAGWRLASGLASCGEGCLAAPNYDRLVDSPLEAGVFDLVPLAGEGVDGTLLIHGPWDGNGERLAKDLGAVMDAAAAVFGDAPRPTEDYLFLLHSGEGLGGGTEYYNSTVVHTDPKTFWDRKRYEQFLSLIAHEYFHTWNVKRFRPAPIARYDYQTPTIFDLLWAAEGLTSYYDLLLLRRAGVVDEKRFLEMLGELIDDVLDHPGYGRQSLAQASEEAWIKGYHPGRDRAPDKRNQAVSFYAQGGLLGLVLDLKLREATAGQASLDTLMTMLYEDFPLEGPGYDFLAMKARVEALAGPALADAFERWVYTTEALPVTEALASVGLTLKRKALKEDAPRAQLGARLREREGRTLIRDVDRRQPAFAAGLQAEDELLAVDEVLLRGTDLAPLLRRYEPGQEVLLTLGRRGQLQRLPVTLGAAQGAFEIVPQDGAAEALRQEWLSGSRSPAP